MTVKLMGPGDFLDPDIKDLVEFIDHHGFETTDSGDGHSKLEGKGAYDDPDAWPVPHVAIRSSRLAMYSDAERLYDLLVEHGAPEATSDKPWQVQATYDPANGSCIIVLSGLLSSDVPGVNNWRN